MRMGRMPPIFAARMVAILVVGSTTTSNIGSDAFVFSPSLPSLPCSCHYHASQTTTQLRAILENPELSQFRTTKLGTAGTKVQEEDLLRAQEETRQYKQKQQQDQAQVQGPLRTSKMSPEVMEYLERSLGKKTYEEPENIVLSTIAAKAARVPPSFVEKKPERQDQNVEQNLPYLTRLETPTSKKDGAKSTVSTTKNTNSSAKFTPKPPQDSPPASQLETDARKGRPSDTVSSGDVSKIVPDWTSRANGGTSGSVSPRQSPFRSPDATVLSFPNAAAQKNSVPISTFSPPMSFEEKKKTVSPFSHPPTDHMLGNEDLMFDDDNKRQQQAGNAKLQPEVDTVNKESPKPKKKNAVGFLERWQIWKTPNTDLEVEEKNNSQQDNEADNAKVENTPNTMPFKVMSGEMVSTSVATSQSLNEDTKSRFVDGKQSNGMGSFENTQPAAEYRSVSTPFTVFRQQKKASETLEDVRNTPGPKSGTLKTDLPEDIDEETKARYKAWKRSKLMGEQNAANEKKESASKKETEPSISTTMPTSSQDFIASVSNVKSTPLIEDSSNTIQMGARSSVSNMETKDSPPKSAYTKGLATSTIVDATEKDRDERAATNQPSTKPATTIQELASVSSSKTVPTTLSATTPPRSNMPPPSVATSAKTRIDPSKMKKPDQTIVVQGVRNDGTQTPKYTSDFVSGVVKSDPPSPVQPPKPQMMRPFFVESPMELFFLDVGESAMIKLAIEAERSFQPKDKDAIQSGNWESGPYEFQVTPEEDQPESWLGGLLRGLRGKKRSDRIQSGSDSPEFTVRRMKSGVRSPATRPRAMTRPPVRTASRRPPPPPYYDPTRPRSRMNTRSMPPPYDRSRRY